MNAKKPLCRKFFSVLIMFVLLFTAAIAAIPAAPAGAAEYSRQGFYGEPYIFEIGWNVSGKTAKELECRDISISEEVSMTVWYGEELKGDMSDKDVTAALADVLSRIIAEQPGLEKPVVLDIKNTGNSTPEELTEKYYNDDNIMYYGAVLPFADSKTRQAYLEKTYDDNNAAYFSVSLDIADNTAAARRYLDKAYKDDNIAFFSICHNCLEDSLGQEDFCALENTYAAQACRDERYAYAQVCGCEYEDICGYYGKGGHHAGGHHGGGHHRRNRCDNWD